MERIADGVHQISTIGNSFLIDGDGGVTLVDTGMPGSHGKIESALAEIGRHPADIASIVVTHGHADHFGSAARLKSESGAVVYASDEDAPVIQRELPIPPPPGLGPFGFLSRLLPSADPVIVDQRVAGTSSMLVPDLEVVETPGHTPGHISLLLHRGGGIMFVGDAAVADRAGKVKRGWMNRSTPQLDGSIRRLALHEFEVACFGHSGPIIAGASAAFERYARRIGDRSPPASGSGSGA